VAGPRAFHSKLRPGVSLAGVGCGAGTLGAWVRDVAGRHYALSAWHVLVGPHGTSSQAVLQPSPLDNGRVPTHFVGRVADHVRGPEGDAAIVQVANRLRSNQVLLTNVNLAGARDPKVGDVLHKVGRTTEHTLAEVVSVGVVKTKWVPGGCRGFVLEPVAGGSAEITRAGDSGAIWYDATTSEAVGLHLEGELDPAPSAEVAIASCITDVLAAFRVRIA
jgi:hypothetical protein